MPSRCRREYYQWFNNYLACHFTYCKIELDIIDFFGIYKECYEVQRNIDNAEKGIELSVNWPSNLPHSFSPPSTPEVPTHTVNLRYDASYPHDFVTKIAKSTVWTSVYLTEKDQYELSPLYQLPPDLFKGPIKFSSQGFAGLEEYITFNTVLKAKLTQVQGAQEMVWGIATSGCRPPIFTLSTNWIAGSACSLTQIHVTEIKEDENFACTMQFIAGDPKLNAKGLTQMAYAVAPLIGSISISTTHAENIMQCLFPTAAQTQFSFWGQWSLTTPGTCSPCAPRTLSKSGANPIPRMCNQTAGETGDCCFTCQNGYTSLNYLGENNMAQQHCIANCAPGKMFDNPNSFMPRCIDCPTGKYSQPDGMACQSCKDLGFDNAYVGPRGCIPCGSRRLAKGASDKCPGCNTFCESCSSQAYVPPGGTICVPCPPGSILRSSQATNCTPCPSGFYASDGRCLQCPTNTFKAKEGDGNCTACGSGYESIPDRTACVPCSDLNFTVTPFAIYQPGVSGCTAICNKALSYPMGTNPYVPNGCISCTNLKVPNGMYTKADDCSHFIPCTNVPALNSTTLLQYIGPGNIQGICPWKCAPGWYLQGSMCLACISKTFNSNLHIYTDGCVYACIPGLYYRGLTNTDTSCTQRCSLLEDVLSPRCSDYFLFIRNNGSKVILKTPTAYTIGYCGSNSTDPTSDLGVVRHKGMYGVPSGTGFCGDSMLSSINEECDDGNMVNGDGCNSLCLIERNGYWDCDVLGELCLPNCGWPDLQGFALPAPPSSSAPWCAGITYARDFLKVSVGSRGLWMQTNLISCQCVRNPHQTLPYSECNFTNKGCRQCLSGHFQDDLYGRCSKCGSSCALGFWTFNLARGDGTNTDAMHKYGLNNLNLCGPSIATSQDLSFADPVLDPIAFGVDQIKLGCAPCSAGAYNTPSQVIFTTPDCQWKCKRDYSNVTEPKYYCKGPLNNLNNCNQLCLNCEDSLVSLQAPSSSYGWYIQSCADGIGHAYVRCTNLSDPNAQFIGNSLLIGDNQGCPWSCKSGYQLLRGKCIPCKQTTCSEGEMLQLCDGSASSYYCAPCSLIKPVGALQALQVWGSQPPKYSDCVAKCEPGFAYQAGPNETCTPCSYMQCDLNQLLVPCNQTSNTACIACPFNLQPNFEFYLPGTCKTRCTRGFALSSTTVCVACTISCSNGQRRSSDCQLPEQRLQLPTCIACDPIDIPLNKPTLGRLWGPDCSTSCYSGWMFQSSINLTCVQCNVSQCAYGQQGICINGLLICETCPSFANLDINQRFQQPGDCTLICAPGFEGLDCTPISEALLSNENNNNNQTNSMRSPTEVMGVSLLELQLKNATTTTNNTLISIPIRTLPHS